ncbi:protease inhibitor I9 family protein [Actinokineospora soli]|uniref:Protease inhibitor I9 family protein n=1 Tax=Actinokineospora soli TaxID=1048753 RepID=A0ABW2TIY9_9PSEU
MSNRKRVVRGAVVVAGAAALGLATLPSAGAAEGQVLGADAAGVIEGSYIVVLKDGVLSTADAAAKHGAEVTHRYTHALNGYAAKMTETEAKRAAADPRSRTCSRTGSCACRKPRRPGVSTGSTRRTCRSTRATRHRPQGRV